MKVQEALLRQKIDPYWADEILSGLVTEALDVRSRCNGYTTLAKTIRELAVRPKTGGFLWSGQLRVVVKTAFGEIMRIDPSVALHAR